MKKSLEERQAEMQAKTTKTPQATLERRKRERVRQRLEKLAGPGKEVRIEVIPAGTAEAVAVKDVVTRLKAALKTLPGLTPEQIQEKVSALTSVLHVKMQLEVNASLDLLSSPDPAVSKGALNTIETLMPFITQISELNIKMQVALGLSEAKGKLVPRRITAAPAASPQDWEASFGDTLTNKVVN